MIKSKKIHKTVILDKNIKIGKNTFIWHWTHVSDNVCIGENCILGQNTFIGKNVKIGNGVKIQNNVSVFDGVIIEDDVFIGPSVVFTNVKIPRSFINQKKSFFPTIIKKGASIGANSTIICGNTIGIYSLVGAGTTVTKNVSNYSLEVGSPNKHIGWVTKQGKRIPTNYFKKNNIYFDKSNNTVYEFIQNKMIAKKIENK
jgi:UDP-2-acetamido-3-amino-2,3-dideoxy-glucuronate N-acetyltransferase